jgi:hypothetical protein
VSRKDRIALVISALYSLFPLVVIFEGKPAGVILAMLPLLVYWGYRFIKGDISFIGKQ